MRVRQVDALIEHLGGQAVRQHGSHRVYRVARGGASAETIVPQHAHDLADGTAHVIERDLAPVLGKGWLHRHGAVGP
ncbi:MAG: type II toxin-antitoxin system HicA family toxin [Bifidobacteriaceae bacterium]|jgi:predicted RNA binding protein YcfA (HicA-like mRNA interferase family)|nr:type II toxin-antitoxin system HicA family toxin [Bifidobacteriaceae bacterium]